MPDTIKKFLAFDFGERRIGIALGITITGTASPIATVSYDNRDDMWRQLDPILEEWKPQLLVVGQPGLHDETPHVMAAPIRKFCNRLKDRYNLPLEMIEEHLSSSVATTRLVQQRQQGRRKRIDKREIDRQAALLLAESWLESN